MNEEQKKFIENLRRNLGMPSNWGSSYNLFSQTFSTFPRLQSTEVDNSYEGPLLNPDTLTKWSKKVNTESGERKHKKEVQDRKNQEALQYLNVLSVTDPSRVIGAAIDNKPFLTSMLAGNVGLGTPLVNDIVDLVTPNPANTLKVFRKVGNGINLVREFALRLNPTRLLRRKASSKVDDVVESPTTKILMQRDLTKEGVMPYTYEEVFDEKGNIRPNGFYNLISGRHGAFYSPSQSPTDKVRSYLASNNPRRMANAYENILSENNIPYERVGNRVKPTFGTTSGWRIGIKDTEYSPDSFNTLLGILERNLKAGRKIYFSPKFSPNKFVKANEYNQKSRYRTIFSNPEFEKAFKENLSKMDFEGYGYLLLDPIPAGYNVDEIINDNGLPDLVFSKDGKEVGRLATRPLEEVIEPINSRIQRLNTEYGMKIPFAKVENNLIFWPHLDGVLLKQGGIIPNKNVKLLKRR